jgi:type II secretory pathway component PulF
MAELRRRALVPVALSARAPARRVFVRSSPADAVAASIRMLATMVGGGASLERALRFAAEHAGHDDVRAALVAVRGQVLNGRSLGESLREHSGLFGTLAPAMVRSGEESGALDAALTRLADSLDAARDVRDRLRAALLYPALLGGVAGIGVLVLLAFVVPRFVAMLDVAGAELPLSTRVLVAGSSMLLRFGAPLVVLGALGIVAIRWRLQDPAARARFHAWRLTLPLAGRIELENWTARFSRALGILLEGGTPLLGSLRIATEGVGNLAIGQQLADATTRVARGERLATSLEGVLPPLAVQLLAVGEEGAALGEASRRVADAFEGSVQRSLRQAVGLLEPALIVTFGGLVGFVALAMLQAIYSINASLP